jgi:hypothetical protein
VERERRNGIMAIDKKFRFLAVNPCKKGVIYTEEDGMVLLAKDDACLPTLKFYHDECVRLGAGLAQVEGIRLLIERVEQWRAKYPNRCKVPDVNTCEAENTIGGE